MKFSLSSIASQQVQQSTNTWNGSDDFNTFSKFYDTPFNEIYLELLSFGLTNEQAHCIVEASAPLFSNNSEKLPQNLSRFCLKKVLPSLVKFSSDPLQSMQPTVMALVGPTGVGKTTTIAKLAARVALRARRRVELLTLDTYRIAAVDQLKTYAEIIGVGCHVARSVLELNMLVRRFSNDATVLIDTAGRGPNDLADHMELADYLCSNDDILKTLVLSATTNPIDAIVAAQKYSIFGVNRLAITKLDETIRPGALVGWANETKLPLLYLCAGQRVPEDLEVATPETSAARIARAQFPYAIAA
jgi:flagellar biosynthesis protein FlhF